MMVRSCLIGTEKNQDKKSLSNVIFLFEAARYGKQKSPLKKKEKRRFFWTQEI